jgi:hypothetical protein
MWDAGYVHIGYWWVHLRERNHLKDMKVDGRIIIKWFFKRWNGEAWTGIMWFRIRTAGGRL